MEFEQWLAANGYDATELAKPENAKQRKHLEAAWKAETAPAPEESKPTAFDEEVAALRLNNERIQQIQEATIATMKLHAGDPEKTKELEKLSKVAIEDKSVDAKTFKLQLLYASRSIGPMMLAPRKQEVTEDVLECAVCMTGGLDDIEKEYKPETLEAAHKQFKSGLGLHGLIVQAAKRNGWNGYDFKSDWMNAVRYGFRASTGEEMYAAVTGPSTYSLPNILSNVANKFLRVGFNAVDDTWSRVSARRNFNDFKTATTIALTGGLLYKKVPPSGELKHASVGETVYTNKADTYGVLLGIDRQSLINDDLGALTTAGRRLGRGGALKVNDIFWTIFLNNSSFFTSGNNNVESTAAALSLTTLGSADKIFRQQTDPDGFPLGIQARILLAPPGNRVQCLNMMNSTYVVGTTGPTPANNAFVGAYSVESSPYMSNSSYTGNSATATYLLADPNDMPVIEIGFLGGMETPTVETQAAEFNMLGIALRGYWDFGVALQEFRGGVRIAGA